MVKKFANLSTSRLKLIGSMKTELKDSVRITPVAEFPFTVTAVSARDDKNIRYTLEKIGTHAVPEYVLTVENIAKTAGRYFDTLILKTDSEVKPEIRLTVFGNISE